MKSGVYVKVGADLEFLGTSEEILGTEVAEGFDSSPALLSILKDAIIEERFSDSHHVVCLLKLYLAP